jgi:pyruvate/2-oxoacid:ferredoxin oxidoreductase beta subunit
VLVEPRLTYKGPTSLHIHCPCAKGWLFGAKDAVRVAKLATETGMWTNQEGGTNSTRTKTVSSAEKRLEFG